MKTNGHSGFSLVELIGVVVILGMVATLATYAVTGVQARAKLNGKKVNAAMATRLIQSIRAAGGEDAASANALAAAFPTTPTSVPATAIIQQLQQGMVVNGISFKLSTGITPTSYETANGTMGWDTEITYKVDSAWEP